MQNKKCKMGYVVAFLLHFVVLRHGHPFGTFDIYLA